MAWGQGAIHFRNTSAQVLAYKHAESGHSFSQSRRRDTQKGNLAKLLKRLHGTSVYLS